jgi:hypothetical protein
VRINPYLRLPGKRRLRGLTFAVTSVATLAVVAGTAAQPGAVRLSTEPVSDSYPWYEDTAADNCGRTSA